MSVEPSALKDKRVSTRRRSEVLIVLSWLLVGMNRSHLCAEDAPQYRFQREIETGELVRDELIAVPLDKPVYFNTQDSLNDLRIEDADGTTVPFIVRRKRETETYDAEKTWRADDISLKPIKETGLEIRFELNADDPVPDGLRIITPLRNFEQRLTLFAIDSVGKETPIVEDEVIFDYSQFMDVRNVEIKFPETDARSFRIDIDALTIRQKSQLTELTRQLTGREEVSQRLRTAIIDRPFRIDRIELWAEYKGSRTKVIDNFRYDVEISNITIAEGSNTTALSIDTNRQPITQLNIITSEKNFQRSVFVSASNGNIDRDVLDLKERVDPIADQAIHRFQFRSINDEDLSVVFPEVRRDRLIMTIANEGNPSLKIDSLVGFGHVYEIIFLASKNLKYILRYGNPKIDKPDLDTAAIRLLLEKDIKPITATLSPDNITVTEAISPPATLGDALNNPNLIGCIVLIMIAVLIWLLYSAAQKVDQLPDDQTSH